MPNIFVIAPLLLLIWILSGLYIVEPDEQGVVKSFGKWTRTTEPGLHYHLPYPIETVKKPKVTQLQRFEFGFLLRVEEFDKKLKISVKRCQQIQRTVLDPAYGVDYI